ncbi:MAG: hypothetical protein IJS71_04180 [Clostridia bacterium]|nr:hypothetical protein [Clostridia bacterium]
MKYRVVIIIMCVLICLCGCSPSHSNLPQDNICVKWKYHLSPYQRSSFVYNEIEYRLVDSQWEIDEASTQKIGTLLTGGTGGSSAPIVVFGIPVISGYRDAYTFRSNEEEIKFIATAEAIWVDSRINFDDKENLSFYKLGIIIDSICDENSNELTAEKNFTFEEMIDKSVIIEQQEIATCSYRVRLYLEEVKGLFCYIEIVRINDLLYTPLQMCAYISGQGQQLVLLTDEWTKCILNLIT